MIQDERTPDHAASEAREAAYWDQFCARAHTVEDLQINGRFPTTRHLIQTLGDCREKTILELGCGRGLLAINLALALRPQRVVGVDIAPKSIEGAGELARQCGVDGVCEFHAASAYALPLPDDSVDVVVGVAILHHLEKEAAARELVRVLRPGGEVLLAENNGDNPLLLAARAVLNRFPWFQRESEDGHPLTRAEIDRFAGPFARVEVAIPYVELFRTLAYGDRPLSRFEPALARIDRALCNPLTRGLSMGRWIRAVKGE
jgi:SAM-dependent methyltransferase